MPRLARGAPALRLPGRRHEGEPTGRARRAPRSVPRGRACSSARRSAFAPPADGGAVCAAAAGRLAGYAWVVCTSANARRPPPRRGARRPGLRRPPRSPRSARLRRRPSSGGGSGRTSSPPAHAPRGSSRRSPRRPRPACAGSCCPAPPSATRRCPTACAPSAGRWTPSRPTEVVRPEPAGFGRRGAGGGRRGHLRLGLGGHRLPGAVRRPVAPPRRRHHRARNLGGGAPGRVGGPGGGGRAERPSPRRRARPPTSGVPRYARDMADPEHPQKDVPTPARAAPGGHALGRRMRRLRRTPALRRMVAETRLAVDDLVAPLFVREGIAEPQPDRLAARGGPAHASARLVAEAAAARRARACPAMVLFGVPEQKDAGRLGRLDSDGGIVQVALRRAPGRGRRRARAHPRPVPRRVHRPRPLRDARPPTAGSTTTPPSSATARSPSPRPRRAQISWRRAG